MKTLKILNALILIIILSSCSKPIQETKPIRKYLIETVFASGVLEAEGTYNLTAQTEGYINKINFEDGSIVKAGITLVEISNKENMFNSESAGKLFDIAKENTTAYSPLLKEANESIGIAKKKMVLDSLNMERYKKLFSSNSIAKVDYENVELSYSTSKTNYRKAVENLNQVKQQTDQDLIIKRSQKEVNSLLLSRNEVRAVVGGMIYKKFKNVGDYVRKGDVIATIGLPHSVYAKVSIDESNIKKIKIGQEAVLELNTNKEKQYKGKVTEILASFDEGTQSFICKLVFVDSLDFKIANTQLQANIIINTYNNALVIPRNFLYYGNTVRIKGNDNPVSVSVNIVSNEWVQILSGINENTTIETENIK